MKQGIDKNAFLSFKNLKLFNGQKAGTSSEKYTAPVNVKSYDTKELEKADRENIKDRGFSAFGDAALWAIGKLPNGEKLRDNTSQFLADKKVNIRKTDSEIAKKIKDSLGVKRGGPIDRFTSTLHEVPVGEEITDAGKKLHYRKERVDSLAAPVKHTTSFVLPVAGAAAIADATSFQEDEPTKVIDEKTAMAIETGILKEAAFDKISSLNKELEKKEKILKVAKVEREILIKDNNKFLSELDFYKKAYEAKSEELEKEKKEKEKKEKEEKISKATILAEKLLEDGIIKQTELQEYINFFIETSEEVREKFEKMLKSDKTLENKLYIIDDSKEAAPNYKKGLGMFSSTGQTVEEAVADLL